MTLYHVEWLRPFAWTRGGRRADEARDAGGKPTRQPSRTRVSALRRRAALVTLLRAFRWFVVGVGGAGGIGSSDRASGKLLSGRYAR
jgi:hypothetical protein